MKFNTIFVSGSSAIQMSEETLIAAYEVAFVFEKDEEARTEAFAANFPKYCKVRVSTISGDGGSRPIVTININTATNKATGEVNETALKRQGKVIEILKTLGII